MARHQLTETEIENLLAEDEFFQVVEIPDGYESESGDFSDCEDDGGSNEILENRTDLLDSDTHEALMQLLDERKDQTVELEVLDSENVHVPVLQEEPNIIANSSLSPDVSAGSSKISFLPDEPGNQSSIPSTQRSNDWKFKKCEFPEPHILCNSSLPPPPVEELSPLEYFRSFFSDEFLQLVVEQSNIYALQRDGIDLQVDKNEIEQFLGILLLMGICKIPSIRLYWSNECRYPPVADVMSRNRFVQILKYLHFADNQKMPSRDALDRDKLYKVRPLLDSLRSKLQSIPPEEYNSIDEQIIPYKGRSSIKQYIKNKPHKWGFKVFTRAGASGLMYDFKIYVGKNTCVESGLGFTGDIVLDLCDSLPKQKNFKVFADNWFSSLPLAVNLQQKGIYFVGTVQSNRLKGCTLKSDKELKKGGRGSYDWRVETKNNISLVRWYDRKAINFVSSYACVEPLGKCRRYSAAEKKFVDIPRPRVVEEYNKYMGGVDLIDMLLELYRIDIRSRKWYTRIVFWCLGVAVTNSWLLYRRHQSQRSKKHDLSLLNFQTQIAHALTMAGKINVKKRGRPSKDSTEGTFKSIKRNISVRPVQDIRFDNVGHMPDMTEKKGRCKVCQCTTQMLCTKCKLNLCLTTKKKCFTAFHSK